jgi:hypothetical protein
MKLNFKKNNKKIDIHFILNAFFPEPAKCVALLINVDCEFDCNESHKGENIVYCKCCCKTE